MPRDRAIRRARATQLTHCKRLRRKDHSRLNRKWGTKCHTMKIESLKGAATRITKHHSSHNQRNAENCEWIASTSFGLCGSLIKFPSSRTCVCKLHHVGENACSCRPITSACATEHQRC